MGQQITIQSSGGLSDAGIERMVKDAEEMAGKDKERKEVTELKNDADSNIYSSERSLREHKESLPEDVCKGIEEAVAALRAEMEKEEPEAEEMRNKIADLQT